ncbi:hypothetical protein I1H34_12665 [Acaryochloris marina S15]|nr:hypothetical protein I1H34_12665 [Acaryochloris marina S15]
MNTSFNSDSSISKLEPLEKKKQSSETNLWTSIRNIIALQNQAPELKKLSSGLTAPTSFNQERLLLLDKLRPNSIVYNIPFAFRIFGDLDISTLEKSIQVPIYRHEVLRTTLLQDDYGVTIQHIHPMPENTLSIQDLHMLNELEQDMLIDNFVREVVETPFNLDKGPLIRANLLKVSSQDFILVLTIHHAIFDGWSEGILFDEISKAYKTYYAREDLQLDRIPIQYSDYSIWQRQWITGDFHQVLTNYWKTTLDESLRRLDLPVDISAIKANQSQRSACEKLYLNSQITNSLKELSCQQKTTLFCVLLSAFYVLLYHYTGQSDLAVCTPTASRNRSELKGMIGYFVNLLVLRNDLSYKPSFRQLIERAKQVISGAIAHQDLPAQDLLNCIAGDQMVMSQVLFVLQNTPQKSLLLPDLEVQRFEVDNGIADFDLFLSLMDDAGSIKGILKYNADLFEANSVLKMLQHYKEILSKAIVNPDSSIDNLLKLSVYEKRELTAKRHQEKRLSSVKTQEKVQFVTPRNETERKLQNIWQIALNIQPISITDNFFDLGGKSLAAVKLFSQIEKTFGKKLLFSDIFKSPTIEKLAIKLKEEETIGYKKSLVAINCEGSKPPLFCIHSVEPSILHYRYISNYLDTDQPFYALQPPALCSSDEILFASIEEMALYYANEIQKFQPQGPYFLTGHSMGGVIAYEVACKLQGKGEEVAFLGLIDSFAPQYHKHDTSSTKIFYQLFIHCRNIIRVSPKRKIGYIIERLKYVIPNSIWSILNKQSIFEIIDISVHNELTDIYQNLPIYKKIKQAHYKAYKKYIPTHLYSGSIFLYRATERPTTIRYYSALGWEKYLSENIEIIEVPGNHNAIVHEPYVKVLARKIQKSIDKQL